MVQGKAKTTKRSVDSNSSSAVIRIGIFDGAREPLGNKEILLRIRDGQQQERVSKFVKGSSIKATVPFFDNLNDNYTVLTSCDGYRDAGFFPVRVSPDLDALVDLMLVRKNAELRFQSWPKLKTGYPRYASFLACAGDEDEAAQHYAELVASKPPALASMLNLTAAMSAVQLPSGTPLDYFRCIEWDKSLAQDRFFGFADQQIVQQVREAARQGVFVQEPVPGLFHEDATSSYKQVQFGEANVQLTFHETTTKCIRVEPDIDYYKDLAAHTLLEVIPNTLSHGLTSPQTVYVLRWIAGRHAGIPEFDPGYTLD